jgi:hypothetical protein
VRSGLRAGVCPEATPSATAEIRQVAHLVLWKMCETSGPEKLAKQTSRVRSCLKFKARILKPLIPYSVIHWPVAKL